MEELLGNVVEYVSSAIMNADVYLAAIAAVLLALAGVAKLTKNKVDDKWVAKGTELLNKARAFINKYKPKLNIKKK